MEDDYDHVKDVASLFILVYVFLLGDVCGPSNV